MRKIKNHKFSKIYDLQNSSRSRFYKKILHPHSGPEIWSSSITTLPKEITKEEFDKGPVLNRFEHQLNKSGLITKNVLKPNFNWSCEDISNLKSIYKLEKYIILFPFSSAHLTIKRWPFYNELIQKIKEKFENKYQLIVAPGPNEIKIANEIDAKIILNNERALNISQLSTLIKDSSFVIANDTGPAHMAAHLNSKGIVLFGSHTTAFKVSIERENFKPIQVADLNNLSSEKVLEKISNSLI